MCVIISIYNEAETDKQKSFLADNLRQFSLTNPDGTAHFGVNTKHREKIRFARELRPSQQVFEEVLSRYNVNHFHFRNATSGKADDNNIHFWKYKNWLFGHNGTVGEYTNKRFSDSLILFRRLIKEKCFNGKHNIDLVKIAGIIKGISFWGRLIFINTESGSVYYMGDYKLYLIDKNILIVSSAPLNTEAGLSFYGIGFETENPANIIKKDIQGVFKINPFRREFKEYDIDFDGRSYWNNYDWRSYDMSDDLPKTKKQISLITKHGLI